MCATFAWEDLISCARLDISALMIVEIVVDV